MRKAALLFALAYILPSTSVIRKMVKQRDELQLVTLRVEASISFYGQAAKDAGASLGVAADRPELQTDATVEIKFPGRCRLEATSVESGKLSAAVVSNGKRRSDGAAIPALDAAIGELCELLAIRSADDDDGRAAVERHLGALKVDLKKTSLARFGGQVAYVIGDEKEGQPQLWVYKDSFLPARARFADASGQQWDLKMLDYSSPATGEWFPRTVELLKGDEPVFKLTALKSDARAKLDDKRF